MIFNFIGAVIRWCWEQLRFVTFCGQKFNFSEYLNGPKNADDEIIDGMGHRLINRVIGWIILGIILFFSVKYWA